VKKSRGIIKKGKGHDAGYKTLLSHPKVVEDLLTFFVDYVTPRLCDIENERGVWAYSSVCGKL
jgi:hypothetical protein